jgi:hypothetical protein
MAPFTVVSSVNNRSNNVLMSIVVLDHLVKHFPICVLLIA